MTLEEMLADLTHKCDVGTKKNSKGFKESWIMFSAGFRSGSFNFSQCNIMNLLLSE